MKYENFLKKNFETIPHCRKIVIFIFLNKNNDDLLKERGGFLKSDINRMNKKSKNSLMEQNEEYLEYLKIEEESIIKKTLKK